MNALQIITLLLSVYVLVALLFQSVMKLPPETEAFLDRIDFFVCLVFLADFFARLAQAPSRLAFMKWGWIDLVSSIPMLDAFRYGRAVRIIRILRILRAVRSTKNLLGFLVGNRKSTSFAAVVTIAFILVIFSSIAVLQVENVPESNIKTPVDAFWWAYTTITTVGYGDAYPVTAEGRLIAAVLITAGVGLFGTLTGFVASLFVEPDFKKKDTETAQLIEEIQALRRQVQSLETKIDFRNVPSPDSN